MAGAEGAGREPGSPWADSAPGTPGKAPAAGGRRGQARDWRGPGSAAGRFSESPALFIRVSLAVSARRWMFVSGL